MTEPLETAGLPTESAHAMAWVDGTAGTRTAEEVVVINISGRGDKDVAAVAELRKGSG